MNYHQHTNCRVCDSTDMVTYFDLGSMPLSNNLCEQGQQADLYPLQVMLCNNCGLSQLSIVIDPQLLFGHYVYRSSISAGYRNHCRQMAKDLQAAYGLTESSFMIDIAGNDGALLYEFQDEIGLRSINVDPAENLVKICESKGVRVFRTFWGMPAAKHLMANCFPMADLITATNVFAHVDNVKEFMEAVKLVLKSTGVLVLEFPYLIDFIERGEFDTIYFEHLSYFSIGPIVKLCQPLGLTVMKVERQDIHGGSVRVHIGYGKADESVRQFVLKEYKYRDITLYNEFVNNSHEIIERFRQQVKDLRRSGFSVAGFAASAKGNTLLNCAGMTSADIEYIIDETPEKIGKYSPGVGIPIVGIHEQWPDYIVILSWNFAAEIKAKLREFGYQGEFIVPIV